MMIQKKRAMLNMFLIVMLSSSLSFAQTVSAKIEVKPVFTYGEEVYFNYTILSTIDQRITFVPYVACPHAPAKQLEEITANVTAEKPYKGTYTYLVLDKRIEEYIEPQECVAYLEIISPEHYVVNKTFRIDIKPSLNINITVCKDRLCTKLSKVFEKGEEVFVKYESNVSDVEINAILTYPDGTEKKISLPASIKAEQVGTYIITVTASKEGYRSVTVKDNFGVIEREVKIEELKPKKEENISGLPKSKLEEQEVFLILGILIVFLIVVLVILAILVKEYL